MVDIALYKRMEKFYNDNLPDFVSNHPGEYVLIESGNPFKASFFPSLTLFRAKEDRRPWLFYGPTYFSSMIPRRIPRRTDRPFSHSKRFCRMLDRIQEASKGSTLRFD